MSSVSSGKNGTRPSRGHPGEYVVVVSALPLYARKNAWKDVKDLIRSILEKEPDLGYAKPISVNIFDNSGGIHLPSALCSLKYEKAARTVFHWLAGNYWYGSCLSVTLFDGATNPQNMIAQASVSKFPQPIILERISKIKEEGVLRPVQTLPMMSPSQLQEEAYQALRFHQPGLNGQIWTPQQMTWSTYPPTSILSYSDPRVRPASGYSLFSNIASVHPPLAYHNNPDGTPVNTTQGTVAINESRAVLVRNLDHQASPHDVQIHFASAGVIERCDINTNHTNRKKCTALLTFRTAEEARTAVSTLSCSHLNGRAIYAEIAKDETRLSSSSDGPSSPRPVSSKIEPGPIIVNGCDEDALEKVIKTPRKKAAKLKERRGDDVRHIIDKTENRRI